MASAASVTGQSSVSNGRTSLRVFTSSAPTGASVGDTSVGLGGRSELGWWTSTTPLSPGPMTSLLVFEQLA
jgi:hypothetical protein